MTSNRHADPADQWILLFVAIIITILAIITLSGCSATSKLRRAERLIRQAEAAGAVVKSDTVFITKVIPGAETTVKVPVDRLIHSTDTFTVYQDRIKIHFKTLRDTLRINVDCPDSVIRVPVIVHKSIICPPPKNTWRTIAAVLAFVLALFILIKR